MAAKRRCSPARHWTLWALPLALAAVAVTIWFWVWYEGKVRAGSGGAPEGEDADADCVGNAASGMPCGMFAAFGRSPSGAAARTGYVPTNVSVSVPAWSGIAAESAEMRREEGLMSWTWGWSVMGLLALDNNLACGASENVAGMIRGMEEQPEALAAQGLMHTLALFDATGYRPWKEQCAFSNFGINDTQCPVCFDWVPRAGVKNLDITVSGVVVGETWDEADLTDREWINRLIGFGMRQAYDIKEEPFRRIPSESMIVLSSHGNAWESFAEDWRCNNNQAFGSCKAVQVVPDTIAGVAEGIVAFNANRTPASADNNSAAAAPALPPLDRLGVVLFDACFMAAAEVISGFVGTAKVFIGSLLTIPAHGQNYHKLIGHMATHPNATAVDMGRLIPDYFLEFCNSSDTLPCTLVGVDLDRWVLFEDRFEEVVQQLSNAIRPEVAIPGVKGTEGSEGGLLFSSQVINGIALAAGKSYQVALEEGVTAIDLGNFLMGLASSPAVQIRLTASAAAGEALRAYNASIINYRADRTAPATTGIDLYMPTSWPVHDEASNKPDVGSLYEGMFNRSRVAYLWGNFLKTLYFPVSTSVRESGITVPFSTSSAKLTIFESVSPGPMIQTAMMFGDSPEAKTTRMWDYSIVTEGGIAAQASVFVGLRVTSTDETARIKSVANDYVTSWLTYYQGDVRYVNGNLGPTTSVSFTWNEAFISLTNIDYREEGSAGSQGTGGEDSREALATTWITKTGAQTQLVTAYVLYARDECGACSCPREKMELGKLQFLFDESSVPVTAGEGQLYVSSGAFNAGTLLSSAKNGTAVDGDQLSQLTSAASQLSEGDLKEAVKTYTSQVTRSMGGAVIPLVMTTTKEQQEQIGILTLLGQNPSSSVSALTPMSVFGVDAIWGAAGTAEAFGLIGSDFDSKSCFLWSDDQPSILPRIRTLKDSVSLLVDHNAPSDVSVVNQTFGKFAVTTPAGTEVQVQPEIATIAIDPAGAISFTDSLMSDGLVDVSVSDRVYSAADQEEMRAARIIGQQPRPCPPEVTGIWAGTITTLDPLTGVARAINGLTFSVYPDSGEILMDVPEAFIPGGASFQDYCTTSFCSPGTSGGFIITQTGFCIKYERTGANLTMSLRLTDGCPTDDTPPDVAPNRVYNLATWGSNANVTTNASNVSSSASNESVSLEPPTDDPLSAESVGNDLWGSLVVTEHSADPSAYACSGESGI